MEGRDYYFTNILLSITGNKPDEHSGEFREVYIDLGMDRLNTGYRLVGFIPGKRVAIGGTMTEIHVHVNFLCSREDRRVKPGTGSQFIPHVKPVF